MRQKIYYSKTDINKNLYTPGREWMTEDYTEYIGLYHKYITGEVYTEPDWNPSKSKKLIKFAQLNSNIIEYKNINDINTKFKQPVKYHIVISDDDIQKKFITRYFLQKINEPQIIEIDLTQYDQWKSGRIDRNLYIGSTVNWKITGPVNTIINNNVKQIGVIDHNTNEISNIRRKLPFIDVELINPLEFYVDNTLKIPADINN